MQSNNARETAELVRKMRATCGLTLRQLSWRAKTSAAALADYEAGRHEAKISTLRRIASASGCELTIEVMTDTSAEVHLDTFGQVITA